GLAVYLALQLGNRAGGFGRLANDRGAMLVGLALLLLVVPSLVYLYPHAPFLTYGTPTAADVTAFERNGRAIGTTSTGEYYPVEVTDRPTAPLPTNLARIGRLDRGLLPLDGSATLL